jgi:hypothetical protein
MEIMGIVRIVLITLLLTVGLGSLVAVIAAKESVRKVQNRGKQILTRRESIVYRALFAGGIVCILVGILVVPRLSSPADHVMGDGGWFGENPGFSGEDGHVWTEHEVDGYLAEHGDGTEASDADESELAQTGHGTVDRPTPRGGGGGVRVSGGGMTVVVRG